MSFFAFTATPKHKTLESFGHRGPDGRPAPFHLYSMRQAIEERFILDVLKGYMTYQRFFQLAKRVAEDPVLDKQRAAAALARFVSLHPTNIAQKTEIVANKYQTGFDQPLLCAMYAPSELDGFAAVFFKLKGDRNLADNAKLNAWLDPAVDRFKALKQGDQDDGGTQGQEDFRGKLNAFTNLYAFLGQIVPFADADLEKLYTFARLLLRKLPPPAGGAPVDLGDDVVLASYKLKLDAEGDLTRDWMLDRVYGRLRRDSDSAARA